MNSDLNAEKSCEEKSIRRNNSASLYPPPRPPRHRRLSSGGHAVEKEQRQSGNQARLLTGSLQESLLRSDSHCQDQYYSLRSDFMSSNKINNRLITNQLYEATAVGKGFIARDIQFINTAGPQKFQAVALRSGADKSIFYRCKIVANQDTLYAHSLRQFFKDSEIWGTVDFIFGNAAVVLQNCTIRARKPLSYQENTLTAQGRTDPNMNTGISIHKCNVVPTADLIPVKTANPTYLGRPWKLYSRTVVMHSQLADIIAPAGWLYWNATFALDTLFYREFNNSGPGSVTKNRVNWPGYRATTSANVVIPFTVPKFIGSSWIKSAGIAYDQTL